MLEFLLALLTTATVALLLVPLLRPRPAPATARLDNDLAIYRDQLAEIERERAQGLVSDAEAQQASTEIQRRLLAAAERDSAAAPAQAPSPALHRFLTPALCLLIPLFALGLYLQLGRPGLPASPFASHVAPAGEAPADLPAMIAAVRARLAAAPDDAEAQSSLGEMLVVEAQGTVTPAALEAFRAALRLAPADPRAAYYLGLHEAQSGDAAAAIARWQKIAEAAPPDAPYLAMLNGEIARVAREAKLPVPPLRTPEPPAAAGAPRGPTQEQMEQMGKLSPEERTANIRAMVDGLAAKLKDNPGDREGWLRLANARKVLGQADLAAGAYAAADRLQPLDARGLADWAEAVVRQLPPGGAVPPAAVAVLKRLEQAEPRNGLALFYLGAADFAEGRKPEAARRWKVLLSMLPPDAPIRAMLQEKIKEAE